MFTTGDFLSEMNIQTSLTNSEFLNIQLKKFGKLFHIQHQTKGTFLLENITIDNTLSDGIHIDAFDKQRRDITLKVQISNLTALNTKNSFNSLIKVFENSELEIHDSTFKKNFGLAQGSVVCGDYRGTKTNIYNSIFEMNSAAEGGIFCAKDASSISCTDCEISNNFAVSGGIFVVNTDGLVELKASHIHDNKAISIAIGEILDSVGVTKIESSTVNSNLIVSLDYLTSEKENCSDLCHIPSEYLSYYIEHVGVLSEINNV